MRVGLWLCLDRELARTSNTVMHGIHWALSRTPPRLSFVAAADNPVEAEANFEIAQTIAQMNAAEDLPHV